MSTNTKIVEDIKTFLDSNENCNKKEFVAACGKAYDDNKTKGKKSAKKDNKQEDDKQEEDKPKKELTAYQKYVKEQMPILKAREDEKKDGEAKKKANELMKEIGEMWQAEKGK